MAQDMPTPQLQSLEAPRVALRSAAARALGRLGRSAAPAKRASSPSRTRTPKRQSPPVKRSSSDEPSEEEEAMSSNGGGEGTVTKEEEMSSNGEFASEVLRLQEEMSAEEGGPAIGKSFIRGNLLEKISLLRCSWAQQLGSLY